MFQTSELLFYLPMRKPTLNIILEMISYQRTRKNKELSLVDGYNYIRLFWYTYYNLLGSGAVNKL